MPNFLARLIKRTWGLIPMVKPSLVPLFAPPSVKGRNRFFTSRLKRRTVSDELSSNAFSDSSEPAVQPRSLDHEVQRSQFDSSEPAVQPRSLDHEVQRSQEPQLSSIEPFDLISPNTPSSSNVEPTANLIDSDSKPFALPLVKERNRFFTSQLKRQTVSDGLLDNAFFDSSEPTVQPQSLDREVQRSKEPQLSSIEPFDLISPDTPSSSNVEPTANLIDSDSKPFAPPSVKERNRFFTSRLKRQTVSDGLLDNAFFDPSEPTVQPQSLDREVQRSQEPQLSSIEPFDLISPNTPSSPNIEPTANLIDSDSKPFAPPSVKERNRFFTSRLKRQTVSDGLLDNAFFDSSEPAVQPPSLDGGVQRSKEPQLSSIEPFDSSEPAVQPQSLDHEVQRSQEPQLSSIEPFDLISPNTPSFSNVEPTANRIDSDSKPFDPIESKTESTTDTRSTSQIQSNSLDSKVNNSITNATPKGERIKFQSILKQTTENLIQRQAQILPIQSESLRTDSSQSIINRQELEKTTQLPLARSIPVTEKYLSTDRVPISQINSDQQHLDHPNHFNSATNLENITNSTNTTSESPAEILTQQIPNSSNQFIEPVQPLNDSRLYLRATQTPSPALAAVKPRLEVSTDPQSNIQDSTSSNLVFPTQSEHRRTSEKLSFSKDEPTVQVTIGRVVVRVVTTPPSTPQSQPSKPTESESRLSLEDYLRQREGGSR